MKDSNLAEYVIWGITEYVPAYGSTKCVVPGGLAGFVSSNAGIYSSQPPAWNPKAQSLDFKVTSAHFTSAGEIAKGSYDLLLREDVAKCLWGNNVSRGKASISVTSTDGEQNVEVTNVSSQSGWMKFSATGFHFSSPTISVKIANLPSYSITCLKGKSKKILTGKYPKCPAGYKIIST